MLFKIWVVMVHFYKEMTFEQTKTEGHENMTHTDIWVQAEVTASQRPKDGNP